MDTNKRRDSVIWRPYITTKDGRRIWAKWYGKRAFPISINSEGDERQPKLPRLE